MQVRSQSLSPFVARGIGILCVVVPVTSAHVFRTVVGPTDAAKGGCCK